MSDPPPLDLERPRWGADPRLAVCGFTLQDPSGLDLAAHRAALACAVQVHGAEVHHVEAAGGRWPAAPERGDGLWTTSAGLCLAVRAADCVPLLLWDAQVGAVAAVHSGWRGTAADMAGAAVAAGAPLGVEPARLRAAIGPCIGVGAYEVGDEVLAGLRGVGLGDADFGLRVGPRGRPHVDLRRANRSLLRRAGLRDEHIEDVGGCTFSDRRYPSYRRDGAAAGRLRALIALSVLGLALAGCGGPPTVERAVAALDAGDAEAAEAGLRERLRDEPDDALARATLARALHAQGRDSEAVVEGRLAVGLDPALWQASYNLACHLSALGRPDDALRWLQRAVLFGGLEPAEVVDDPDLAALKGDHRFLFYEQTGVLPAAEQDVVAWIEPRRAAVGEVVELHVVALSLNRPLMAPREALALDFAAVPEHGAVEGLDRRQTLRAGERGDREFFQHELIYRFRPLRPGALVWGPLRARLGDAELWAEAVALRVDGEPTSGATWEGFFAVPQQDDAALIALARGEGPWQRVGEVARVMRFRAADEATLPLELEPPSPGARRSMLLRRGSEGESYVVDRLSASP